MTSTARERTIVEKKARSIECQHVEVWPFVMSHKCNKVSAFVRRNNNQPDAEPQPRGLVYLE
jgi:hypothetical protein